MFSLNTLSGQKFNLSELRDRGFNVDLKLKEQDEILRQVSNWEKNDQFEFFTSGSTGNPRPIVFDKSQIQQSAKQTADYFGLDENSVLLLCLPLQYVAGQMMLYRALVLDCPIFVVDADSAPISSLNSHIDFAAMVPMQLLNVLNDCPEKMNLIDALIVGGSAIQENINRRVQLIKTAVFETYGMTETLTHVAVRGVNSEQRSDCFEALRDIELGIDNRGCLNIYASYLGDERIQTNDVVEFEDFNRFKYLGRLDRVINSGGIKLHPESIETKMNSWMDRTFYVGSKPDEILGEKLVLYIEGEPLDQHTEKLLNKMIEENLNRFERPKEIEYMFKFERTVSGKIKKQS